MQQPSIIAFFILRALHLIFETKIKNYAVSTWGETFLRDCIFIMTATTREVGRSLSLFTSLCQQHHLLSFHTEQLDFFYLFCSKLNKYYLPIQWPPNHHRVQVFESYCLVNYTRIINFCLQNKKESSKHIPYRSPATQHKKR